MKTQKSLVVAAGLLIGGLNVSAENMKPEQVALKETREMKTYVIGIKPEQESKILAVERDYAKSVQVAHRTVNDEVVLSNEEKKLWNTRHEQIKAILTADQFKEYTKVEKVEKYNSRHNSRWAPSYHVQLP
jgi:hypothetical protein